MQKKFESGTFLPDSLISCRTLYKANGFSNDDLSRPIIGVCNSFTDIVPGHRHLKELAEQVKYGVYRAGGTPVEFGCIAVCDGVCTTHRQTALRLWHGRTGWTAWCSLAPAIKPFRAC